MILLCVHLSGRDTSHSVTDMEMNSGGQEKAAQISSDLQGFKQFLVK